LIYEPVLKTILINALSLKAVDLRSTNSFFAAFHLLRFLVLLVFIPLHHHLPLLCHFSPPLPSHHRFPQLPYIFFVLNEFSLLLHAAYATASAVH